MSYSNALGCLQVNGIKIRLNEEIVNLEDDDSDNQSVCLVAEGLKLELSLKNLRDLKCLLHEGEKRLVYRKEQIAKRKNLTLQFDS